MSHGVKIRCWGDLACFTRPELKVERVSYDTITPSAARGILEAVFWKPEIRWVIDRLQVLKPIRFVSLRRNEVASKIPDKSAAATMRAGRGNLGLYVEEERQQRAATLLRDVDYVIGAHFEFVSGEQNVGKYLDQFNRRARAGQCYARPYLGCREFAAHFCLIDSDEPLPSSDATLAGSRDLGWVLHDIDFQNGRQPRFFHAIMNDGVIEVPPFHAPQVRL